MADVVLDASALLALLNGEPGWERVAATLPGARLGAVNLAEVVGKLAEHGLGRDEIDDALGGLGLVVVPFDADLALGCGMLRPATRERGLSLGDRACLVLAAGLDLPVLTCDGAWKDLPGAPQVTLIRPVPDGDRG